MANHKQSEQRTGEATPAVAQAGLTAVQVGALRAGLRNATHLFLQTRLACLTRSQELASLLTAKTLLESVQFACANSTDSAALTLWEECQRLHRQVEARFDALADHDAAYYVQPLPINKTGELDAETEEQLAHWSGIELH